MSVPVEKSNIGRLQTAFFKATSFKMLLIGDIHTQTSDIIFFLGFVLPSKCKSLFLAYYFANFSRFPWILCMHLFYFDTFLNIKKPPGYNNTHPWLRINYIQKKKCHKSNDFTDIVACRCLVLF